MGKHRVRHKCSPVYRFWACLEGRIRKTGRMPEYLMLIEEARAGGDTAYNARFKAATHYLDGDVVDIIRPPGAVPDGPLDLRGDIEWVYKSLGVQGVTPVSAPTPGAWAMREWANDNPGQFFKECVVRCLPPLKPAADVAPGSGGRKDGQQLDVMDKLREESTRLGAGTSETRVPAPAAPVPAAPAPDERVAGDDGGNGVRPDAGRPVHLGAEEER